LPIDILRPRANGDHIEYETVYPAGTPHWDAVNDETPDEDATYIQALGTTLKREIFKLTPFVPDEPVKIANIKVVIRSKRVEALLPAQQAAIKTHGTNYQLLTLTTPSDIYENHERSWEKNPYTGLPWKIDEINDLQAGIYSKGYAAGNGVRATQVYVEVLYFVVSRYALKIKRD